MSNRVKPKSAPAAGRVSQARRADEEAARRRLLLYIGAGVVLALLAVALFVTTRPKSSADPAAAERSGTGTGTAEPLEYGTVTVTGANVPEQDPQAQSGAADPAIGQPVPEVTGQRYDGKPITIPASGRPKVVTFLAHWCPHCQAEVPRLTEHLKSGLPADVDLFAVSTSATEQRGNWPPETWLGDAGWPIPTLVDDQQSRAAQAYGIGGFPFFVAVDAAGKVVARDSGELTMDRFDELVAKARGTIQ